MKLIFLIILGIIAITIFVIIFLRHNKKKDFDLTPRNSTGEEINIENNNNPGIAPVYEGDFAFEDWQTWEDFLQEVGVIDIRNGMIEYETGNNSRKFIMLAEEKQSNPYLKTDIELNQSNMLSEIFLNGVINPLKITTQSQKVEMTDFLNELKEHSKYLKGTNDKMKQYAQMVIDDTLKYQRQTGRFENRTYLQFEATVTPDEVYGDTPDVLEEQIHEKALEKLLRQIERASSILKKADHPLEPLDTFGLLDVLYKTFHRESSVKMRFEDIIRLQRFSIFTSHQESDKLFKEVNQRIQIENQLVAHARDAMWLQQQIENKEKLANGQDYYQSYDDSSDKNNDELNWKEFESAD